MNGQWPALILFAIVTLFTPGPNNMMLMTSGAHVGYRRTVPQILGTSFGFGGMVFCVGIGIHQVFERFPVTQSFMQVVCMSFLCFIAWKIATNGQLKTAKAYQPMRFSTAVWFQWVNPKGWSTALSAVSLYHTSAHLFELVLIAGTFILVGLPSSVTWVLAGSQMSRWLSQEKYARWFNWSMASLLLLATSAMVLH